MQGDSGTAGADTEIEHLADLDAVLSSGRALTGLRLQDLDLTAYEARLLARTDVEGLVVLGGRLSPALNAHLGAHHALVFPSDPHAPVDPYRATLYTAAELYAGLETDGYESTPDYRAYQWMRDGAVHRDAFVTLLRAIHDDSISDALDEFTGQRPVVGVMGGHALARGTSGYAAAARLGHALASAGLVVATGGGPGAMEAANLGALAAEPGALDDALRRLAAVPTFRPSVAAWVSLALEVRAGLPVSADRCSLGIPTWFYGHEPPNVFCDGIGKYFSNAVREDGLLARASAGLVVLEGAAGTVQEIFQAVTPLFYAPLESTLAPLVLVGQEYWSETVPVWGAVQALGQERGMGSVVHLVDSAEEAAVIILDRPDGATAAGGLR
ncbi:Predicted Rossmann fold nucleotide-binding protein [Pedococcus dokdonensis]|uniref:Predicted Rossmann fold nucleotide-binding protein n=1 Tax=Pedococcus dokdonensis TaxID=443156 RepID=A0A1H0LZJ5_9MICO|nr:LOG family protein [Pedococcus dokdonensis]SDO73565.1 Predicted Rossmann fold nucleotide-binding protein [Pedococcus dokdonensis]